MRQDDAVSVDPGISVLDVVRSYPAVWLRDNCPCEGCRDPRSGQKLISPWDLPVDLSVESSDESEDAVVVRFNDGHVATFPADWLLEQSRPPGGDGRSEMDKRRWRAADLASCMPISDWAAYSSDAELRLRLLESVALVGFSILRGVPTIDNAVLGVAQTFGYVRETNYGRVFDVRAQVDANNLAFTGLAIAPHTDNPYRDPVPTLQLLHCLSNAVDGGDSGLVDGFEAAAVLREEDSTSFSLLSETTVTFAWRDTCADLRAERPIIGLDASGRIREVRLNHRSMQAVRLSPHHIADFYAAYRRFCEIVTRPELQVTFRLEPGDCVVFDNRRVLHSRTAYSDGASGKRHLQGCYADMDGLLSTIAVLRRAARHASARQ
jgi:gamma-butyrobetaine dioxygenase